MAVTLEPVGDVLPAVETFMVLRTRAAAAFGVAVTGPQGGGRLLGHFSDGPNPDADPPTTEPATRPTRAQALEVITRMAAVISNAYAAAQENDKPELVEVAALMSAIRLETMFYAEEVQSERSPARVWMDLLETATTELDGRLGPPKDGDSTPGGLQVAGSFRGSGGCGRVEGAETSLWPGSAYPWPYRSPQDLDALLERLAAEV